MKKNKNNKGQLRLDLVSWVRTCGERDTMYQWLQFERKELPVEGRGVGRYLEKAIPAGSSPFLMIEEPSPGYKGATLGAEQSFTNEPGHRPCK